MKSARADFYIRMPFLQQICWIEASISPLQVQIKLIVFHIESQIFLRFSLGQMSQAVTQN